MTAIKERWQTIENSPGSTEITGEFCQLLYDRNKQSSGGVTPFSCGR
jgi:hypothetical protein